MVPKVLENLSKIVDRALAAFVLAGGNVADVAVDEGVDTVFGTHPDVRKARGELSKCLSACREVLESTGEASLFFDLEGRVWGLASRCLEAGLRVGMTTASRGGRGKPTRPPTHGPSSE